MLDLPRDQPPQPTRLAEYRPPDQETYEALSRPEVTLLCPECEAVLVCHWCKTAYDASAGDDPAESDSPGE